MDYEYKNQYFSVEIAEALLTEIWTSGSKIQTIRESLLGKHRDKGGLGPLNGQTGSVIVVQALKNLRKIAKASAIGNNMWRIAKGNQRIFGTGKHWVYLYYFSQDKKAAESKGKKVWRCKIGETGGLDKGGEIKIDAPETRVKNQTRGTPEPPIIALLFRTDSHKLLERVIHGILTLRGKHIAHAQGDEWFLTNPREVAEIVGHINYTGIIYPAGNFSQIFER